MSRRPTKAMVTRWLTQSACNPKKVEKYLSMGADPDEALVEAIARRCLDSAKLLLKRAKPTKHALVATGGDPALLSLVLSEHPDVARGEEGAQALIEFAEKGWLDGMALLIGLGADVNYVRWDEVTPLHAAVRAGNAEAVRLLLEAGADVDIRGAFGRTPLHLAATLCRPDIAEVLIEAGAAVNARDNLGRTPLHYAVKCPKAVAVLLKAGADVNAKDWGGDTPLHRAVIATVLPHETPPIETAKLLIAAGADVNAQNARGWTPLHVAVYTKRAEAVRLLLEAGADPNIADREGKTPLDYADPDNVEVAEALRGAAAVAP